MSSKKHKQKHRREKGYSDGEKISKGLLGEEVAFEEVLVGQKGVQKGKNSSTEANKHMTFS